MSTPKKTKQEEVFCLMASAYRKSYQLDTINMICYPKNALYRLRYDKIHIENFTETIKKLKKLKKIEPKKQRRTLFLFFDKKQDDIINKLKKVELSKVFIPIRWIKIHSITQTETFIQLEVITDEYFDLQNEDLLIKILKETYSKWKERIDINYESSKYFVYKFQCKQNEHDKLIKEPSSKYIWQEICSRFFKLEDFKKTIFLIFRNIIKCSDNKKIETETISANLLGYKLKPRNFYMIELAQYLNPKKYNKLDGGKFYINITLDKISLVDKERSIKYGGPYIIYHLLFYTKRSWRKHNGLLGVQTKSIIKEGTEFNKESEINNDILYPNITLPIQIPFSGRDLVLPGLFFIIGTFLTIINSFIEWDLFIKISLTLLGSITVAFALFYLATLRISN